MASSQARSPLLAEPPLTDQALIDYFGNLKDGALTSNARSRSRTRSRTRCQPPARTQRQRQPGNRPAVGTRKPVSGCAHKIFGTHTRVS